MEKTIEIPEGYAARIEGNKVILEPKESEDERIKKDIITTLSIGVACNESALHPGAYTTLKEAIAYLERQKEQKPAEWSKEDEEMFAGIIADIKFTQRAHNHDVNQIVYEREIDWLESLRDNYKKCNSHWKPSEEQMKEYSYWYKNFIESGLASPSSKAVTILGELLEQLKKL